MSIANFNDTTPAAPGGNTNVTWQKSGDSVSGYVPNATSPLTTKGDIYGFTTVSARIPVGSNGDVLTADSTNSAGVSWQPGSGNAFPLDILQEAAYESGPSNVSSFTLTFPQALAGSGATAFILISADGSAAVGLPAGWTADFNQAQASYARLILCHKTSAGDTSATFTFTTSNCSAYFFEVSGSHALDQSSVSGSANTQVLSLPAITPTANSVVFGAVGFVANGAGLVQVAQAMNPAYKTMSVSPEIEPGGRALGFHMATVPAQNVSTNPPAMSIPVGIFASGGIAYATFSIL